jgi:hypothetical protein
MRQLVRRIAFLTFAFASALLAGCASLPDAAGKSTLDGAIEQAAKNIRAALERVGENGASQKPAIAYSILARLRRNFRTM